ncbi:kielin/chordin-like protein [Oppia nitens]|uniref:kielin/chordin-like protein n=1 Tax=Oppia nitens TaxID=1686743 RepID=UPI0023DB8455|nr:kielin/chordin-like protein [Oppia nitens]
MILCQCNPLNGHNVGNQTTNRSHHNSSINDSRVIYKYLSAKKGCSFKGNNYLSGERIVRRHRCHHCLCDNGFVKCFWQSCPPPPEGCTVIPYEGVCNPSIYNCPIPERNQTMYVKSRRLRQRYGSRKLDEGLVRADCVIRGIAYFTGETIGVASNNCLECRCARNSMYCSPLCCTYQRTTTEENFGINYRRIDTQSRVPDPNPLAHIYEDMGLSPTGARLL